MMPELLTPIALEQAERYVVDDRYWLQEKRDGVRLMVRKQDGQIEGWNRQGQPTSVHPALASRLRPIDIEEFVLDGEWEQSGNYCCWDLLQVQDRDLRGMEYSQRLISLVWSFVPTLDVLPSATSIEKKHELLSRLREQRAEGVVIKDSKAPYRPGRAGQHYKLKFQKTATARVREADPVRDRVSIEMLDGNVWREVCGLKVPNGTLRTGQFVEVRYLYGTPEKRLVQPCFLRIREDVADSDCALGQVQLGGKWRQ